MRVSELEGENVELRRQIRVLGGEEDDPQARASLREKRLEVIRRFVKAVNEVHALSYFIHKSLLHCTSDAFQQGLEALSRLVDQYFESDCWMSTPHRNTGHEACGRAGTYGHRRNVLCLSPPPIYPPLFVICSPCVVAIKEAFAADYRLLPGMHFTVVDIASDSSVGQGLVG